VDLELFSKIRDLVGKDFEFGGSGPDKYDCYNLCREVYKRFGIELPQFYHPTDPDSIHRTILEGKELFEEIDKPEPLALVVFRIKPPLVTHVGVVLSPPYFLHILAKKKSVIERLDHPFWEKRIAGFYRWKGNK